MGNKGLTVWWGSHANKDPHPCDCFRTGHDVEHPAGKAKWGPRTSRPRDLLSAILQAGHPVFRKGKQASPLKEPLYLTGVTLTTAPPCGPSGNHRHLYSTNALWDPKEDDALKQLRF